MTATLFEDIANAPVDDTPEADIFAGGSIEDGESPQRTREPTPGKRGPRVRERECESCGNTFVGGRKICSDCKGTTPRATTAASGPRGSAKLEADLLESTVSLASDISAVAPTVAGVLIARAEVAVEGMMSLAKGRPRVQKILARTASASKVADLMSTIAMVVIAAMVDFGRIPLDSPVLDRLGYADIVRDEKGKAQRNPNDGTIVKERRTLREIHDMMTGTDSTQPAEPYTQGWDPLAPPVVPGTGTGPYTMPPMNWTP